MNNPRLAGRYAKSLLDLAIEQNQLDAVYNDIKFLQAINKSNPDFVAMLKSPVINADKKEKVIQSIINGRVANVTTLFIQLLVRKKRESNLPEIVKAFKEQYNKLKDIHHIKLTTAFPLSETAEQVILSKVRSNSAIQNIELESVVDEEIIGGFKLEVGGKLVDASILSDLNDVRKQFKNNEYIHQLR
ncbi:MAG: ATP synthase F1 subunit delta [Ferruginibacter sp.]|nr:ATP synthase F1 subunit delta [Ferruginibacter sp.]